MASQHSPVTCSTNLLQFKAAASMLYACVNVLLSKKYNLFKTAKGADSQCVLSGRYLSYHTT